MSDLFDQLDAPMAESVILQEDDKLVLTVENIDTRDAGYGDYVIVTGTVEAGSTENGGTPIEAGTQRAFHCLGTVLSNEIGFDSDKGAWTPERKLFVGGTLAVKFLGKKQGQNGNSYASYRVIVKAPPSIAEQLDDDKGLFES